MKILSISCASFAQLTPSGGREYSGNVAQDLRLLEERLNAKMESRFAQLASTLTKDREEAGKQLAAPVVEAMRGLWASGIQPRVEAGVKETIQRTFGQELRDHFAASMEAAVHQAMLDTFKKEFQQVPSHLESCRLWLSIFAVFRV